MWAEFALAARGWNWDNFIIVVNLSARINSIYRCESHESAARCVGLPYFFDRLIMIFVALRKDCHALGKCFLSLILSIF